MHLQDMEVQQETHFKRSLDSTDKILDEIDAKLNGVSSSHSSNVDVNDDPGFAVRSVQKFRRHMETHPPTSYNSIKASSYPSVNDHRSNGSCHFREGSSYEDRSSVKTNFERQTNLLQGYDDDINLLRRLLKENVAETKRVDTPSYEPVDDKQATSGQGDMGTDMQPSKYKQLFIQPEPASRRSADSETLETLADESIVETQCSCDCEEELEKIIKERNELLARIRRGEASRTSIEERQELERQLHSTKTALFQQKKKARQQLEDIEEKLEEAQHYYEEKLEQKDDVIQSLQGKIDSLLNNKPDPPPPPAPLDHHLQEELARKELELGGYAELSSRQKQQIAELEAKLTEEISRSDKIITDNIASERTKWEDKLDEVRTKSNKERSESELKIRQLEEDKQQMYCDVVKLSKKLQEFHKEIEEKEKKIKEESSKKENDYKVTNDLLKNKIESLKEELTKAFSSRSELELEMKRNEGALRFEGEKKEKELEREKKKLEDELQRMQSEVGEAVTKLKEFQHDIEHQDQCAAASICDECHKLYLLLHSMQPVNDFSRSSFTKDSLNGKRSVCELQDVVEMVCRAANELVCEVTRLKREARKRPDYYSLRSNSDASIVAEEVKMLRDKLDEKETELQLLQTNMNQWKDLTAQRLAEKFQEELELQVERKMTHMKSDNHRKQHDVKSRAQRIGRLSKSTSNVNGGSSQLGNETSTVKLLCHLQGRVKQLRNENDLLRSNNYIKGLNNG